jgi:hypothetical protein
MTPQANRPAESESYVFSQRELQRLAAYRAAVVAHFYTDECDSKDATPRAGTKTLRPALTR